MLYLSIFILSWRCKIKFHGDRPSRKSIWTNLDPKSQFFDFFAIFGPIFFSFFVLLAGNVVLYQCHSIAHVLPLCFLIKADLSDLFSRDKRDSRLASTSKENRPQRTKEITDGGTSCRRIYGVFSFDCATPFFIFFTSFTIFLYELLYFCIILFIFI